MMKQPIGSLRSLAIVLAIVQAIFLWNPYQCQQTPRFKTFTSANAVEKVKKILIPIVEPALLGLSVPDVSGSTKAAGMTVHYTMSNIQIQKFSFGDAPVQLQSPTQVQLTLPSTTCTVTMDWSYSAMGLHGSGSATDELVLGLEMYANLFNSDGMMAAKPSKISVNVNSIKITVHGGNSWFYQIVVDVFKGTIKNSFQSALANELTKMINSLATYYLSGSPTYQFTDDISIDYGLVMDPQIVTGQYSLTSNRGNFLSKSTNFQCSIAPNHLPTYQSELPLTFYISDTMGSCLSQLLYQTSTMSYQITGKMVPSNSPIQLNTGDRNLRKLIPNLYKYFPDAPMVLDTYATEPPTIRSSSASQNLVVTIQALVNVTVPANNTGVMVQAFAFNLQMDVSAVVSITPTPVTTIAGKIVSIANNISLYSSNIGDVDMKNLGDIVQFFVAAGVQPQLNALVQKGMPLPQTKGVVLVNPTIVYGAGYLGVKTDFDYNPSAAKTLMLERQSLRKRENLLLEPTF